MLLKDLFEFLPKPSHPASYGEKTGLYPFFTSSNNIERFSTTADYDGEYLIIGDGGAGNCKYYNGKFSASDHNYILKPLNNTNCIIIKYFLMKDNYKILNDGFKGVGIRNISKTYIQNIDFIKNSDLSDDYIVSNLSSIDNAISNLKNKLFNLDEIVKSRFIEMFGNNDSRIEKLTDYVFFQEGPGVRTVDFRSDGTILLTGSNINDNEITFGHKADRFISNELANGKYSHFICDENDILVVASAIAPEKFDEKVVVVKEDKKYCLNTGIIRFKPNLKYLTRGYFIEFLKSNYFKDQVAHNMKGIAQMHFGPSHLKTMTILIPNNLQKQIEFEKFKELIDKSKLIVQKQIDLLQELLDKKMNEYFC